MEGLASPALSSLDTGQTRVSFATFWAGADMPALDKACLASFAAAGYPVTLYSFDEVRGLPAGIAVEDAGLIVPRDSVEAFRYQGKPNLSHFSDYFRYRLFARTSHTWIDTDMLLLKPLTIDISGDLFAKETRTSICGAIMHIAQKNPNLVRLIERTEGLMHQELAWGATGPRLLTQILGRETVMREARPAGLFFPIHYDDFWKPFLPDYRAECEQRCARAFSLHLWNNLVVSLGIWKDIAPPEGSFLHDRLQKLGLLSLFRDVYPATVMANLVENWRFRKSGGDIGILKVARQAWPSLLRTTRPRVRAFLQARR